MTRCTLTMTAHGLRREFLAALLVAALPLNASARPRTAAMTPVVLPSGTIGAGFDDLNFSPELDRVLVPSGRTGKLFLLDPATGAMEAVEGFGTEPFPGGRGGGTTSADAGAGLVFAIDRSTRTLNAVDPAEKRIVFTVTLAGGPDIVRFVAPTREVWVTEPHDQRIEIFSLSKTGRALLAHAADIAVPEDSPEALQVDAVRNRLYTNQESGTTFSIDLASRTIVDRWPIGCGPRGLALDERAGFLFVGCEEGQCVVLDVAHGGREAGRITVGAGIDLFSYSAALHHLYLPGAKSETLSIVGVNADGTMKLLDTVTSAPHAHSGTTDGRGRIWVSDPTHGRLLTTRDPFPDSQRR